MQRATACCAMKTKAGGERCGSPLSAHIFVKSTTCIKFSTCNSLLTRKCPHAHCKYEGDVDLCWPALMLAHTSSCPAAHLTTTLMHTAPSRGCIEGTCPDIWLMANVVQYFKAACVFLSQEPDRACQLLCFVPCLVRTP
jgi:hypothetical protein